MKKVLVIILLIGIALVAYLMSKNQKDVSMEDNYPKESLTTGLGPEESRSPDIEIVPASASAEVVTGTPEEVREQAINRVRFKGPSEAYVNSESSAAGSNTSGN